MVTQTDTKLQALINQGQLLRSAVVRTGVAAGSTVNLFLDTDAVKVVIYSAILRANRDFLISVYADPTLSALGAPLPIGAKDPRAKPAKARWYIDPVASNPGILAGQFLLLTSGGSPSGILGAGPTVGLHGELDIVELGVTVLRGGETFFVTMQNLDTAAGRFGIDLHWYEFDEPAPTAI